MNGYIKVRTKEMTSYWTLRVIVPILTRGTISSSSYGQSCRGEGTTSQGPMYKEREKH